jgi:hypothetical protein
MDNDRDAWNDWNSPTDGAMDFLIAAHALSLGTCGRQIMKQNSSVRDCVLKTGSSDILAQPCFTTPMACVEAARGRRLITTVARLQKSHGKDGKKLKSGSGETTL